MEPKTNREISDAPDPMLCQAIKSNGEAWDELFARCRQPLLNTALRLLRNYDDAEEALQDGLLSAFRSLSRFEGRSQLSTWLTSVVINAALMRLRRIRREAMTFSIDQQLRPEEEPLANRIPDWRPNPEERFAREERRQILEEKIRSLPTMYRQAVLLCDVQGMSTRKAAEALGLPIGTLKSQLHRARLQLSEEFAKARSPQRVFQPSRGDAAITRYRPTLDFTEKLAQPAT